VTLAERYQIYQQYLLVKFHEKDWHGVCDAAMDIRELVAKHPELEREVSAGSYVPVCPDCRGAAGFHLPHCSLKE